MRNRFFLIIFIWVCTLANCKAQETIILTTGDTLKGKISVVDKEHIRITKEDGSTLLVLTKMLRSDNMTSYPAIQEQKMKQYSSMKHVGTTFFLAGIAGIVAGGIMVANAGSTYYSRTYHSSGTVTESGSLSGGLGATMIGLGVPSVVGGILLWSAGDKKLAREKRRMGAVVSLNSVRLTYYF